MRNISLLLVERNDIDLAHTRACLAHDSAFRILGSCTDAGQAFAMIQLHRPDAIVCEMVLHGMDGISLLQMLRRCAYRPIFVLTSGIASDAILQQARDCGADYFLMKPYEPRQLIQTLQILSQQRFSAEHALPSATTLHHIHRMLTQAGFLSHTCGFHYLATGVYLVHENPSLLAALSKELYVQIARQHHTSARCVERDMRHAIHTTCQRMGIRPFSNGAALRFFLRMLQKEDEAALRI